MKHFQDDNDNEEYDSMEEYETSYGHHKAKQYKEEDN